jgi:membrane-associated phospholipid phosphatase
VNPGEPMTIFVRILFYSMFPIWCVQCVLKKLDAWDWIATRWLQNVAGPGWLVVLGSRLGDGWLYAAVILWLRHLRLAADAGHVAACVVLAWGASALLKLAFQRSRPDGKIPRRVSWQWREPSRLSFPSQHVACAVAFAVIHPAGIPIALLVCWSRVAIRAHFVGDVLAGIAVGVAAGVWG